MGPSITQRGIKKYTETNENENTTAPNLWDAAKVTLRGNFILTQAYLKKPEKSQRNNQTLHLKELQEQQNPKPLGGRK